MRNLQTLLILTVGVHVVMTKPRFTIGMLVAFQMLAGKCSQRQCPRVAHRGRWALDTAHSLTRRKVLLNLNLLPITPSVFEPQGAIAMLKKLFIIVATIGTISFTSGCSTLADSRAAKGTGISRTYAVTIDAVWKVMPSVLAELSLPMVADNKQEGYILAQRGITALSYGENVAIFVESVNGVTKTRVEVVTKRSLATNIFAPDWGKEILDKLGEKLK